MLSPSLLCLGALLLALLLLWLLSLRLRDASIVDIFWGLGFVLVGWLSVALAPGPTLPRRLLLAGLVTLWGARLSGYLAWRNLGKGEDYRYQAMRRRMGARFPVVSLFTVFWLQGVLLWIISWPLRAGIEASAPAGLTALDGAGAALFLLGLGCESLGDYQLARFKGDPHNRGRVMDRGLWRYTRHPNYFGDFLVWWGVYLPALATGAPWSGLGPLLLTVLLLRVSGVALLERTITERRPDYAAYQARTSAFFPWPPRRT